LAPGLIGCEVLIGVKVNGTRGFTCSIVSCVQSVGIANGTKNRKKKRENKMGADWYSMTCIGLKVPKGKVIEEVDEYRNLCGCVPQVDPDVYPEAKFCPNCGRLIRRSVTIDKPLYDAFAGDYYNDVVELSSWTVKHDTDAYNFYICIYTSGLVERYKRSDIPNISEEVLDKFKADMESLGLWDEEQFGLWTITYCSY
jgi:hypothetical protein